MALAETFCWHFDFSESHCEGSWLFQRPRGTTFASFHELCTLYFVMLSPIHRVESARARSQNVIWCNSMILTYFDWVFSCHQRASTCHCYPLLPIIQLHGGGALQFADRSCSEGTDIATDVCLGFDHDDSRWMDLIPTDASSRWVWSIHVYTCLYMSILYYLYNLYIYTVQCTVTNSWCVTPPPLLGST